MILKADTIAKEKLKIFCVKGIRFTWDSGNVSNQDYLKRKIFTKILFVKTF